MRTMALAGWVCMLAALSSLTFAVAHNHSVETETHHVSAGHLLLLTCHLLVAAHGANVTWSRAGRLELPGGAEVRDRLLWFLPVQASHNGTYTCEIRDETRSLKLNFGVSVSTGQCPDPPENISVPQGVRGGLPCKQKEIFRLNKTRSIRWMKDCRPVEPISVDESGYLRLPVASEEDGGKYTCLVDISLDGRKYTAARSIQLTIKRDLTDAVLAKPEVMFPRRQVVVVEVGKAAELKCLAYIGFGEDPDIVMYWTVDGKFVEEYEGLVESWKYTHNRGRVYGLSTLSISKVLPLFLNVSIHCNIMNRVGRNAGLVLLQEADHSKFYTSVAFCLTAVFATLALAATSLFFKVEVLLTYRKLLRHFYKQAPDGKIYDGYVSVLCPDTLSSAETVNFALRILPGELEKKHGYSLYIRGRDDCPGDAFHEVIAATVRQCRRLIIILSADPKSLAEGTTEEASTQCDDRSQLCYEQKIGLYDALTQNEPRVILLEIGGPVDYSRLPESLRYYKRKQGALKWKPASLGTHNFAKSHSDRRFWKNLRYRMPSVPAGRLQTVV